MSSNLVNQLKPQRVDRRTIVVKPKRRVLGVPSGVALVLAALLIVLTLILLVQRQSAAAAPPPPFSLPTTGYVGWCWDDPKGGGARHQGIDVWTENGTKGSPPGNPVFAVYDGTILRTDDRRILISLDTLPAEYEGIVPQRAGLIAYYTHLDSILVTSGRVTKGQLIGYQGNKGVDGLPIVHLHFSLKKSDVSELDINNTRDPSTYLGMNLRWNSCGTGTSQWMAEFVRTDSPPAVTGGKVDLVLVIDTTGSMGPHITAAKAAAVSIVNAVKSKAPDSRIAIIDFRDFPSRTGFAGDYPYRDGQAFSGDPSAAVTAINNLSLGFGGDGPETRNCALLHAIRGDRCAGFGASTSIGAWRPGVFKRIIYLTDAPALSPEPFTGFTGLDVVVAGLLGGVLPVPGSFAASVAATDTEDGTDAEYPEPPIAIFPVVVGDDPQAILDANEVAQGTGGAVFTGSTPDEVVEAILAAIEEVIPPNTAPSLSLPPDQTVQYSDALTFGISASDPDAGDTLTLSASGLPSALTLADNGDGTGTVTGTVQIAAGTYPITFSVDDGNNPTVSDSLNIIVTREDALVEYSGDVFVSTGSPLTLRAAVNEVADGSPGDITNAAVFFDVVSVIGGGTTTYGPVSASAAGEAALVLATGLPASVYGVDVRMDPDNGYYRATPADTASLVVYEPVAVDIKPLGTPNSINLGSNGVIPVAILGTPDLDAADIDPSSVVFAGANVAMSPSGRLMARLDDIDGDGIIDLVMHFRTQATNLHSFDTEACLDGQTFGGVPLHGCDSVRIVPVDSDGDGFGDDIEATVGTDQFRRCSATPISNDEASDAWPADFNDNQVVNLSDLVLVGSSYNRVAPDPAYNARFDLNTSGSVNLSDVILMGPFYNKSCTP